MRNYILEKETIDVSDSMGVPVGGIGTGYCVYGKYGFILPNFDDMPNQGKYEENMNEINSYDYFSSQGQTSFMAITISNGKQTYVLQQEEIDWLKAKPVSNFKSYAYLPIGYFTMECEDLGISVEVKCYSPMIPHDLKNSCVPVQCYEIKIFSNKRQNLTVTCLSKEKKDDRNFVFVTEKGNSEEIEVREGGSTIVKAYCAWYYPTFHTPSPVMQEEYKRYYTLSFANAKEVLEYAKANREQWEKAICKWHDDIGVPVYLKRIIFSSLSSIISSTLLSDDPYIMEIEMPHRWINTADVSVYSGWCYLLNWPELEKAYMEMYCKSIPESGENKGMVWHSLWNDILDYVEEPMFLGHIYRDKLWFGKSKLFDELYKKGKLALEKIYKIEKDYLIESRHGNQTYDAWMMPGIGAYVNSAWIYGLYGMWKQSEERGEELILNGEKISKVIELAAEAFDKYLWDEENGYYHCFACTETSAKSISNTTLFTDQMFGRWLLSIDGELPEYFPVEKMRKSLLKVYENNRIYTENGASCWVNGMFLNKKPYREERHAANCWLGSQLAFASMLSVIGEEEKSLEIIREVDKAFANMHLAAGEYLYSVSADGKAIHSPHEICKDTPRFAPYPRYKCFWEFLVKLVGMKVYEGKIEFIPMRSVDFHLKNVKLAEVIVNIEVKKDWDEIWINGILTDSACIDRTVDVCDIKFVKGNKNEF